MKRKKLKGMLVVASVASIVTISNNKVYATENLENKNVSEVNIGSNARFDIKGQVINVSSNLRIRQQPNTNSNVLGYLNNGQVFNIKGKEGSWYNIEFNGKVGYIHGDYVKEIEEDNSSTTPPTTLPIPPTNNQNIGKGKVTNVRTNLRIRKNPDTNSSVVGYLTNGQEFNIKGKSGQWYSIEVNGKIGYIHGDYVMEYGGDLPSTDNTPQVPTPPTNNESSAPQVPDNVQTEENGVVYNVSSNLRMRNKPSTEAGVIGYLLPGEKVKILGSSGSWYYINYNGKLGYVHKNYIKKVNGSSTPDQNLGQNSSNKPALDVNKETYSKVLDIMNAQIGSPYIYGGSGEVITDSLLETLKKRFPSQADRGFYEIDDIYKDKEYRAFDCSGLMYWSFKQVGVTLGRTTTDQMKNGVEISKENVQPGDLLFYNDGSHVGMYIGNNMWLESPSKDKFIRSISVPWAKIGVIRRVI